MSDRGITVVIVDDKWEARYSMCRVVERTAGLTLVGEAESADTAVAKIAAQKPDVAVVDLRLDGVDHAGIAVAEAAAELSPQTKFVFVTELESEASVVAALSARVKPATFMRKADLTDPERLREVLLLTASGTVSFSQTAARQIVARIEASDPLRKYNLTDREKEVAGLLADTKSNHEIAASLVLQPQSARRLVSQVVHKLGAKNRSEASLIARDLGLGSSDRD